MYEKGTHIYNPLQTRLLMHVVAMKSDKRNEQTLGMYTQDLMESRLLLQFILVVHL